MDYTTLQNDVVDYLKDTEVTPARAQSFIAKAEPRLERDLLDNRYGGSVPQQMLARSEGTTNTDATYTLPTDFLRARSVKCGGVDMRYFPSGQVPSNADGYAEAAVTLDYYTKITPLSAGAPTNWLVTDAYDLYLWAACLQYPIWGQEYEVAPLYRDYYVDALRSLKNAHQPQPRGGVRMFNGRRKYGKYSVAGNIMRFA